MMRLVIILVMSSFLSAQTTTLGIGSGSGKTTIGTGGGSSSSALNGIICGPPLYRCSFQGSSISYSGNMSPLFNSTAPTVSTCSGDCLNTIKYDTLVNPTGIDPYVRVSDPTTASVVPGDSLTASNASSDNASTWSLNDTYIALTSIGGKQYIQHLTYTNGIPQVDNPQPSGMAITGKLVWSNISDNKFYTFVVSSNTATLQSFTISGCPGACLITAGSSVILSNTGVCPGFPQPFPAKYIGIFNITADDDIISVDISDRNGGQGSGFWNLAYSQSRGCSTYYVGPTGGYTNANGTAVGGSLLAGQAWGYCTSSCSSATALGQVTGGCSGAVATGNNGIHDVIMTYDSAVPWLMISRNGSIPWTNCITSDKGYSMWLAGTTIGSFCDSDVAACPAHTSTGFDRVFSNYFGGPNTRSATRPMTSTTVASGPTPILEDWHSGWPIGANHDSLPAIITADAVTAINGGVYQPAWPHNMIYAIAVTGTPPYVAGPTFGHTFSCNGTGGGGSPSFCTGGADFYFNCGFGIGVPSRDGKYEAISSTMLGTMGLDNASNQRCDVFVIRLD